ncbi:hypothetical protein ANCCEY_10298 [Ancylostoma ceylanicum]|uniref:7TM GPCR serpentine receptor class x (Srx) domain-containing protein n=1 Tax=Ancylostoma ceylanicum TaxID=53326 RepID=A0A0D6LHG8_9BILA|nr:hypothetical protein ANCCEY_10298 [Ancylostoma ceylanicum]
MGYTGLLSRKRKRFATNSKIRSELKILVQCIVIAVYTAVMNILWHQSQGLPSNLWFMMALNFMWVLNSGVYPIIYFIVNRRVHRADYPKPYCIHEQNDCDT